MVTHPSPSGPPDPFEPLLEVLSAGSIVYRVHKNTRLGNEFNPGVGGQSRFAFFGSPAVPMLYAAATEEAAVSETILHDVPIHGGRVVKGQYSALVLSKLVTTRDLRLVQFHGLGLRALRTEAKHLTDTERDAYPRTVRWAEAAHGWNDEGTSADGVVWMSRRCNSDRAFVFFGDRVDRSDFVVASDAGRAFNLVNDLAWLADLCAPLHIDVVV